MHDVVAGYCVDAGYVDVVVYVGGVFTGGVSVVRVLILMSLLCYDAIIAVYSFTGGVSVDITVGVYMYGVVAIAIYVEGAGGVDVARVVTVYVDIEVTVDVVDGVDVVVSVALTVFVWVVLELLIVLIVLVV